MDTRPCPCDGDNENCFRCFGTGLMPNEVRTLEKVKADAMASLLAPENRRSNPGGRKKEVQMNTGMSIWRYYSDFNIPFSALVAAGNIKHPKSALKTKADLKPIFKCHICGYAAEGNPLLQVHFESKHKKSNSEGLRSPGGKSKPSTLLSDRKGDYHRTPFQEVDGTRNWGASFRDHGQFGSHPSFDPMDDESKP